MQGIRIDWEKWDPALGTSTDRDLARRIGCCQSTVQNRRAALGIPRVPDGRNRVDWARWGKLAGTVSDRKLAAMISCRPGTVAGWRERRGIPEFDPYDNVDWGKWDRWLGKIPDFLLARIMEIPRRQFLVTGRRREMGLPAYDGPFDRNPAGILTTPVATLVKRITKSPA